jgi:cyclic pyranopterin phosphate synthase
VEQNPQALIDGFNRKVDYLRMSVTDRCDFRCVYCMAEDMQFLPRQQILSLEELYQVAERFVALGTCKIRLTGGEPWSARASSGSANVSPPCPACVNCA